MTNMETPPSARITQGPQFIAAVDILLAGKNLHQANLGECAQRQNRCDTACSLGCFDSGFDHSSSVQIMLTASGKQVNGLSFELDAESNILVSAE